jgi:hypothetical protein
MSVMRRRSRVAAHVLLAEGRVDVGDPQQRLRALRRAARQLVDAPGCAQPLVQALAPDEPVVERRPCLDARRILDHAQMRRVRLPNAIRMALAKQPEIGGGGVLQQALGALVAALD